MTDEEIEDLNFKQYLEAKYYEALFAEFDAKLLMGYIPEED